MTTASQLIRELAVRSADDRRDYCVAFFRRMSRGVHYVRIASTGRKEKDARKVIARAKNEFVWCDDESREPSERMVQTNDEIGGSYRPA